MGLRAYYGEPIRFPHQKYTATLVSVFVQKQEDAVCFTLERLYGDRNAVPLGVEELKVKDLHRVGTHRIL